MLLLFLKPFIFSDDEGSWRDNDDDENNGSGDDNDDYGDDDNFNDCSCDGGDDNNDGGCVDGDDDGSGGGIDNDDDEDGGIDVDNISGGGVLMKTYFIDMILFIINEQNVWSHVCLLTRRAGRSSEVERSLMVRWVVGSILFGMDPLSYFSFQPVLHDWCNKGRGMCYPICGMMHIKEPLLLIDKSSICGGNGFPFSLSEWSLTICLTPYNRK